MKNLSQVKLSSNVFLFPCACKTSSVEISLLHKLTVKNSKRERYNKFITFWVLGKNNPYRLLQGNFKKKTWAGVGYRTNEGKKFSRLVQAMECDRSIQVRSLKVGPSHMIVLQSPRSCTSCFANSLHCYNDLFCNKRFSFV